MTAQNVVIFGRGEKPVVAALLEGVAAAGLRPIMQRPHLDAGKSQTMPNVSAVVADGVRGPVGALLAAYRAAGVPTFIVELPRLRACLPEPNSYGDTFGLYRDTLADLPLVCANRVQVAGRVPAIRGEYLLLIGQKPADMAHGMDAAHLARWAAQTARLAREQYGLPVVFRPHPKAEPVENAIPGVDRISTDTTLREDFAGAAAVITYNSTAGVDAIDAGVPVLYTAPRALVCYADYAQPLGARIAPLTEGERRTFLMRCGSTQWTLEQLRQGTPWPCLLGTAPYPEPELIEPAPVRALRVTTPKPKRAAARGQEALFDGR